MTTLAPSPSPRPSFRSRLGRLITRPSAGLPAETSPSTGLAAETNLGIDPDSAQIWAFDAWPIAPSRETSQSSPVVTPSPLDPIPDSEQPVDQVPQIAPIQPAQPPGSEDLEANPSTTPPELRHDSTAGSIRPPELSPPPALPPAPTKCFTQEVVNEVLDLTDQVASTALFGPIGVGKSLAALTLLHHDRTKARFGRNRHFIRCDDITNSLDAFLNRLSDVVNTDRTTDMAQLKLQLKSSHPFMLVLDGVDHILDPLAPEAQEIWAKIAELGCYEHVCLVTTSRMDPDIHGFQRIKVPTLPEDDAREAFYSLSNLGRSSAVDDLVARLDSHPLSISLLANSVRENNWDEAALLEAWDDGEAGPLRLSYHQNLKDAVESSFRFPTIRKLGVTAREVLGAIASSSCGIEEGRLESTFPGETRVGGAADVLCKFSIIYRQDGFVKMLSPFRPYCPDYRLIPAQHVEVICCGVECSPAPGVPPTFTTGRNPPPSAPRRRAPSSGIWIRRFRAVKRKLLALFSRPPKVHSVDEKSTNMLSVAPAQHNSSVQPYRIE